MYSATLLFQSDKQVKWVNLAAKKIYLQLSQTDLDHRGMRVLYGGGGGGVKTYFALGKRCGNMLNTYLVTTISYAHNISMQ